MSTWEARLAEAFAAVEKRANALPAPARREALARPIEVIARALPAGARAHAGAISAALAAAMQEGALVAADGHDALGFLAALSTLADAWLDHPARVTTLPERGLPAPAVIRASTDRPRLHAPARDRFEVPVELEAEPVESAGPAEPENDTGDEIRVQREGPEAAEPPWVAGETPPVRIAEKGGEPMTVAAFHADVVQLAAETVATLARDRNVGPLGRRRDVEARLFARADAIACTGGGVIGDLLGWWEGAIETQGGWSTWAAVLLLGVFQGTDALDALLHGLERLPIDAADHAVPAAEALAIVPHPDAIALGRLLSLSPHPIARAAGIGALSRLGQLAPDALRHHLIDPSLPVLVAATDAAGRLDADAAAPLLPILRRWLGYPHAPVAWSAARALARWGHLDALFELRRDGRIASVLGGLQQLELVVLCGDTSDMARVNRVVKKLPPDRALFSALGRLGHPGLWAYLAHHLADAELAEDAAAALTTLFGPLVSLDEEAGAPAWRDAIQRLDLDPAQRYRGGEPYRPGVVARECRAGELPRREVEVRLDELTVRAGVRANVDLGRFAPDFEPALAEALAAADRADTGFARGRF